MSFNERLMAFGEWSLTLSEQTPDHILDALINHPLGTIYVTPSKLEQPDQVHPREVARYAGIYRKREFTDSTRTISGSGLVYLLGDQNKRGPGIDKTPIDLTGQTFVDAITAALSGTDILPGDINAEAGVLPAGQFWLQTARYKIEEICRQFGAEYRVTPRGKLDAGGPGYLYPSIAQPVAFIRRGAKGVDPDWRPIPTASAAMGSDSINFATEKLLVAEIENIPTIQGEATLSPPTSKRGPNGSLLHFTDVGAESQVGQAAANDRAAALLAQLAEPRNTVALSTEDFDVDQVVGVGDAVAVWDPEAGFFDQTNRQFIQGEWFFPLNLRIFGATWPITEGMGVYFQEPNLAATVHDLSPYFVPESGSTQLEVGAASRKLIPEPGESLTGIIAPIVNPGITPPSQPNVPTVSGAVLHIMVQHDLGTGGVPFTLEQFTHHLEVHASTTSGFTPDLTTYIGDIAATNSQISAGTPVIGVFELEDPTEYFVRVIAVGLNGLKSPASAQAPVTPGLVADANVINLSASKITTGSLTASVGITTGELVVGGPVPTAWTVHSGTFNIQDNTARRSTTGNNYARLEVGSTTQVITARVWLDNNANRRTGVCWRADTSGNYFRFMWDGANSRWRLSRFNAHTETILRTSVTFSSPTATYWTIQVTVSGDRMRCYWQGTPIFDELGANFYPSNTGAGIAAGSTAADVEIWDSFSVNALADNFARPNASALGTTTSSSSIKLDGDGIAITGPTGSPTWTAWPSGTTLSSGVVRGAVIEGAGIMGSHVVGSRYSTSMTGRRVEIFADTNLMQFWSGASSEVAGAEILNGFFGTDGTASRATSLRIRAPQNSGTRGGELELYGQSPDGSTTRSAVLRASGSGEGAFLNVQENFFALSTGPSSAGQILGQGSTGTMVYVAANAGHHFMVSGSTRFEVLVDRINVWEGFAMNGRPIWGPGAGSAARIDTGTIFSVWSSTGRTLIGSVAASNNGVLRAGNGGGHSDATNADASSFREFTAIINDVSDPRMKVKTGKPKKDRGALRKAAQSAFMGRWDYEKKNHPPHLMIDAHELPDFVAHELGEMADGTRFRGYQNSAMHAWHITQLEELFERIEALETANTASGRVE